MPGVGIDTSIDSINTILDRMVNGVMHGRD